MPHAYYPISNWITKFATFDGEIKDNFDQITQNNSFILATDTAEFSFSNWIDTIIDKQISNRLKPVQLSHQCYYFLLYLSQNSESEIGSNHPLQNQYVQPIIVEIETNYDSISSIEELARLIFICPQYLNRLFNRFVGKSPYQYLTDWRINKAKELLTNFSELEIQQVSLKVGFQSPSQFISMFKQKVGFTPKQFRNLYRFSEN